MLVNLRYFDISDNMEDTLQIRLKRNITSKLRKSLLKMEQIQEEKCILADKAKELVFLKHIKGV